MPIYYDLLIHPDLTPGDENGGFNGTVVITLDIKEPTDTITLHSHELNIQSVKFTSPDSDESLVSVGESVFPELQVKVGF